MDAIVVSVVTIGVLFLLLGSGIWVSVSLIGVALISLLLFKNVPIGSVFATTVWGASSTWTLTALPMFIWMGEILYRSRIAQDMFHGLAPWITPLPGRLLHVNVLSCGIFAAICGSSTATAATIGKITLPELRQRGYDDKTAIGSLCGSATLGLLIPPSIILIVYGVAAEVSIAKLFMAGIGPGLLIMAMFMVYLVGWALLHPEKMPPREAKSSLKQRLRASGLLFPVAALIVFVLGSIYGGFATPTEAAGLGVVGALLISWFGGSMNRKTFVESLKAATMTSCMIGFIIAGASFLAVAMGFTGVPRYLAGGLESLNLSPNGLLLGLFFLYLILGCFLDGISMVVLTTSIILPMVQAAGIDLLWFGIFIVLVVELAQITPPIGFNLFVIQGLTGRGIIYTAWAALPFFLLLCIAVAILTYAPSIATWLPGKM